MIKSATGILELNNLASAIESADQMLKSANLDHIKKIKIGSSLYSIIIKGDAPSVDAALIAGEISAKKSGSFLTSHSIKNPHPEIEHLLFKEVMQ